MQPRLFTVNLSNHVTFRLTPRTDGYVRLEVMVHTGDLDRGVEHFQYDGLALEETVDVVVATLHGLTT